MPRELPNFWGVAVEFATNGNVKRNAIDPGTASALMDNIQAFDERAFDTDQHLMQQLMMTPCTTKKPLGIVLISPEKSCTICGQDLTLRKDRPASVVVYDDTLGSVPGTHFHKTCTNKLCTLTQHYGYYTLGNSSGQVVYNQNWSSLQYFVTSSLTAFSMNTIKRLDSLVVIGQLSYTQIADIFNHVHNSPGYSSVDLSVVVERYRLDRRRVEAGHFQFAVLQVATWYPSCFQFCNLPLHGDLDSTLSFVVSRYHSAFMERYARHRCSKPGCGTTLVLDGNMKNHRNVCAAREAGFAEFNGLPGNVKTGCPHTPQLKSIFCPAHTPTLFTPHDKEPTSSTASTQHGSTDQLAYIVSKKITRQSTFYQVVKIGGTTMNTTWEPASTLPSELVAEFESGIQRQVVDDEFSSGGQTIHTLTSRVVTPPAKRQKVDTPVSTDSGIFTVFESDSSTLKCNTQKDRVKVNYHTAGILAGIWPCGTITLAGELFGAESLSQVYAFIHTFLYENRDQLTDLSTICYDDGCHLKRYAEGKRAQLTETAKRIASCTIVIDKMHFKGHVDKWCQENCNPYKLESLRNVDTEVCEQTFSWLSRYARITRHMNRQHFLFYILYLCDLHNQMHIKP